MFAVARFREVLQADPIVVSCGLANFEQSSWSTHRCQEFWGTHEELDTREDHDKFVMCDGRSKWTIDCGKFDDPDNDRSMRKHIGPDLKITKSILESGNHHAIHDGLQLENLCGVLLLSRNLHNPPIDSCILQEQGHNRGLFVDTRFFLVALHHQSK